MVREEELNALYDSSISAMEFNFESLMCNYNIYQLLSITDIGDINCIATNVKYMGNIKKRKQMIDQILRRRNFMKFHAGTNRVVYKFLDDQSFVAKFPLDENGIFDNISEWGIQPYLKPFNAKMFQTSRCGTVSFSELVKPIRRLEEFTSIAESVYDLLYKKILGKFIMDDIGVTKFMNYGIRYGFGPVFLDYPRVFRLDGGKLHCQEDLGNGIICNGEIDYTDGFDFIVCKNCGKHYRARDLAANIEKNIILFDKGVDNMKIKLYDGSGNVKYNNNANNEKTTAVISKEKYMNVRLNGWGEGEPHFEEEPIKAIGPNIITETRGFCEEETPMKVQLGNKCYNVADIDRSSLYPAAGDGNYSDEDTQIEENIEEAELENFDDSLDYLVSDSYCDENNTEDKQVEEPESTEEKEEDKSLKIVPRKESRYETVYSDDGNFKGNNVSYPISPALINAVQAQNEKISIRSRINKKDKDILSKY